MDDHHESLIESIEIDCEEPYRSQFFDRVKNVRGAVRSFLGWTNGEEVIID
jgi:hypothetical protein